MRSTTFLILTAALCVAATRQVLAHPSAGIVVDEKGQVYFADNAGDRPALWKIDAEGKAKRLASEGRHWLALDEQGRYTEEDLKQWFQQRITMNFDRVPLANFTGALLQ